MTLDHKKTARRELSHLIGNYLFDEEIQAIAISVTPTARRAGITDQALILATVAVIANVLKTKRPQDVWSMVLRIFLSIEKIIPRHPNEFTLDNLILINLACKLKLYPEIRERFDINLGWDRRIFDGLLKDISGGECRWVRIIQLWRFLNDE